MEGEAFYISMIRSKCISELVPLDSELHKSVSVFFFPIRWTKWIVPDGGDFLPQVS